MSPFWKNKKLSEMSHLEWEALCEGCGCCCLHKIQDLKTGDIAFTNVSCRQLNPESCKCSAYSHRQKIVRDCVKLNRDQIRNLKWLPKTCAYRLLDEGKELFWWHPLVSGDSETVHEAGISVRGRVVCEDQVEDIEDHIVKWLIKTRNPREQND